MDVGTIMAITMGCLIPIVGVLVFIVTKKLIEKQLRNNPPISEAQIRAMFQSMGRTASEQQVRQVIQSMKNAGKSGSKYKKRK